MSSVSTHENPLARVYFFFQAEDGIRDSSVTGVQTCALPIWIFPGSMTSVEPKPRDVPCMNRSEEHTSELQSHLNLVCRLLLEKKKQISLQDQKTDRVYSKWLRDNTRARM